jgi:hypothetical protein
VKHPGSTKVCLIAAIPHLLQGRVAGKEWLLDAWTVEPLSLFALLKQKSEGTGYRYVSRMMNEWFRTMTRICSALPSSRCIRQAGSSKFKIRIVTRDNYYSSLSPITVIQEALLALSLDNQNR